MTLTERQLNRTTLARQMLLEREQLGVVDAIRRVTALQAQEPVSPYIALWNRIADFDPTDLDSAYRDGDVIKASLMRITLHAVALQDYSPFQRAMLRTLRASRLHDRRFKATGLTIEELDALVPPVLSFTAQPRSRAEIEEALADRMGDEPDKHVWWAMRTFAPLLHAPTGGPWSFAVTAPAYQAAPLDSGWEDPEAALQQLILRYLEGFGPASAADFAQFAMQRQAEIRPALDGLSARLVSLEGPTGKLLDVPDGVIADGDAPAPPRLLPMWDSILLAYKDRSRVIPEEYRKLIIRRNGDVLPTLLVDGYVAGVWRPTDGGIVASAFHRLSEATWQGLEEEAAGLLALLADRDPTAYSRYRNWWKAIPFEERRMLAA